jgi:hypothetical protein
MNLRQKNIHVKHHSKYAFKTTKIKITKKKNKKSPTGKK